MVFNRHIIGNLDAWKSSTRRKPLILRGARQVGKTTLAIEFAKTYKNSIILNLEKPNDIRYFDIYDDVKNIKAALFLANNISTETTEPTLLFIDEIQESPKAIHLLRYFYEDLPELHVITAGSLLEFSMHKVRSFPVGRVEYLYLHPLNFLEYLSAIGLDQAVKQITQIPYSDFAHSILINLFNQYTIIGGMPEVVEKYIETGHISALPPIYESIWATYRDDVEKYSTNDTERKVIRHIMNTAHLYVDQRIKFQNFGNSNYRSREVGEALHNLDDAKIIQLIHPTTEIHPPIIPNLRRSPRLQFLDTGLINHTLNIQGELLALQDLSTSYKGAIIPHMITQELISLHTTSSRKPNFWIRDKSGASAEVDLVYQYKNMIIPIEIKSGKVGTLKSLHQFIERTDHPYAIRIYAGEFKVEEHTTPGGTPYYLMNLPYYLGTQIPAYVAYFIKQHQ